MENTSSGTNDVVTNALDKYADMVRRICYIYLRSQADVEDIFQNVFLKLLQHTDKFENEEHEKAWLCRVSINQCKDFHKSFFRKNVCSIDDVDLLYEDEVENEVMREVLSLPPKYKDVRVYGKELSEEEAINEIRRCSGTQFDPEIARLFIEKVLGKKWK